MRVASVFVLILALGAGCARKAPDTPEPTPQTAKPPATKASPAKPAQPTAATAPKGAPPAAAAPKPAPPRSAATNPSLDLDALKERLKATKAIGVFTKLTLKNQVDDLLDKFRDHYAGKGNVTMPQLRQSYDLLMMKVLSLLQDDDQRLASDIVASRETIWGLLSDRRKFAALDV
jgi:hypothetical protein